MPRLRSAIGLVLGCALFGCDAGGADNAPAPAADLADVGGAQVWGAGVSDGALTPVSALLADPDAYVGKTVRVEGTAVAVCGHRGCWFNVASDVEGEVLQFKVPDGKMVFGPEIVGETMRAEGVFAVTELDLETTRKMCEANAKAAGEDFDENSVSECMSVYRIDGTGAVQVAMTE